MRLLNTKTLKLKEFCADIPPYAILSHTWEKDEVTFQDIRNLKVAKRRAGYAKVQNACAHARRYNFEWIWIDSCCINKESSAELSEAINSMYQYYEDAKVCYVYLCDVSAEYHPRNPKSRFWDSRWFKRGWTLQELLAPLYVVFLDKDWERIGTRWSLRDVVSAITSIPEQVFEGCDIEQYSVAQRMSWAAYRETTRPEDQAYCLMGIFGVSMPPIYGEGGVRAFMRLQQEIIKISDDHSIFAWVASESSQDKERGLLARSPYEYRKSGQVLASDLHLVGRESSYSFSNNGLRIHLPLEPDDSSRLGGFGPLEFIAFLNCRSARDDSKWIAIHLRKTLGQQYVRCYPDKLALRPSLPDLLGNVHELTVRETPIRRNVERLSGIKSPVVKCYVKLMPSAQHFHFKCPAQMASICGFSENTVSIKLGVESRCESPILAYQCPTSCDGFSIQLSDFLGTISPRLILQGGETIPHGFHLHKDRILEQLSGSGDYISVAFEQRGGMALLDFGQDTTLAVEGPVFEIDCISQQNREIDFMTETLRSPESSFLVFLPLRENLGGSGWHPQFEEVFPSDAFAKRTRDMTYITASHLPDDGNIDAASNNIPFRVLRYTNHPVVSWTREHHEPFTFYVLAGIQEGLPWTDIVCGDGCDLRRSAEVVWHSYLPSRSRSRFRGQSFSSTELYGKNLRLKASIEKNKDLLLGSHLLHLKLEYLHNPFNKKELDDDMDLDFS